MQAKLTIGELIPKVDEELSTQEKVENFCIDMLEKANLRSPALLTELIETYGLSWERLLNSTCEISEKNLGHNPKGKGLVFKERTLSLSFFDQVGDSEWVLTIRLWAPSDWESFIVATYWKENNGKIIPATHGKGFGSAGQGKYAARIYYYK